MTGSPPPGRYGPAELALLGITSLVWGAAYVFIRQGIVWGASPLAFAAARYALSAGAFVALALASRESLPDRRSAMISAGAGGVLLIGLYGGLLYWGEQFTTGGYAAVLASTAPLLTVAFGSAFLAGERLGGRGLAGMGVGFVGATVLVAPALPGSPLGGWQGPLFVLGAMLCAAAGSVLLRRYGRGRQGLWQIGIQFSVAGGILGAAALSPIVPESLPASRGVLLALGLLVAFSSVVGYFAYFALHHRVGPVRANVVAYLAPLVGVAIGSGLFAEPITSFEILGVAVVLVGVTLVLSDRARLGTGAPPSGPAPRGRPAEPGSVP